MPRTFSLTLGDGQTPWNRGLNTAKRPAECAPNEAQVASDVDLSGGTLRGSYGPGTAIATTVAVDAKFVHHVGLSTWLSSTYPDWACSHGNRKAVYTQWTSSTTQDRPLYHYNGTAYQLGLPSGGGSMTVAAGGRTLNRRYAVVHLADFSTFQAYSNPTTITASVTSGATLNNMPTLPASTPDWGPNLSRQVYATIEGEPDGPLYLYDALGPGGTSWTDTGGLLGTYDVQTDYILNWGADGNVDSETTVFDYGQPPQFTVLAEDLYGGQGDSGIQFAGLGSTVRWSHTGKPWAWPRVQTHDIQDGLEAIVVWQGQAIAFTPSSVWSFAGAADYAITPTRVSGAHPIKKGFGKTAKATPFGIAYVSREGLALFDGISSRIVTKGLLDPLTWLGGVTYANAAYSDGSYKLNLWGTDTIVEVEFGVDGVRVTTNTTIGASALHVTPRETTNPGLFVAEKATGALMPWRAIDGTAVDGAARQAWSWTTALLPVGAASRLKRFNRMRVACALNGGTLDVTVSARDIQGDIPAGWTVTDHTQTITDAQSAEFWLPAGLQGQAASVTFAPSSGDVEVYEATIEGEVFDG